MQNDVGRKAVSFWYRLGALPRVMGRGGRRGLTAQDGQRELACAGRGAAIGGSQVRLQGVDHCPGCFAEAGGD